MDVSYLLASVRHQDREGYSTREEMDTIQEDKIADMAGNILAVGLPHLQWPNHSNGLRVANLSVSERIRIAARLY
jgi:hypothetical protein